MNKMKKLIILSLLILSVGLTGCNKQMIDTKWSFDYAYVELPDGTVVEGEVDSWKDFDDGDQLQVTIDGITYLSNSSRIVLVEK